MTGFIPTLLPLLKPKVEISISSLFLCRHPSRTQNNNFLLPSRFQKQVVNFMLYWLLYIINLHMDLFVLTSNILQKKYWYIYNLSLSIHNNVCQIIWQISLAVILGRICYISNEMNLRITEAFYIIIYFCILTILLALVDFLFLWSSKEFFGTYCYIHIHSHI